MSTTATSSANERLGTIPGRSGVPWFSVLSPAVVMAYADGFWVTSLRGAVGSIERTQTPFASWMRESTLVLPFFVLAVLGALTLALRWFGPALKPRTFAATALIVAAAGTLVGIAEMAASSAYDYHLQSATLQVMGSMRYTGAALVPPQEQASFGLQLQAVGYGAGILLVTNLVLVGWVVAMRGGRLDVSANPANPANPAHGGPFDHLRLLLAAGLVGSAVIHAAVVPQHLTEWAPAGTFFIDMAAAGLAVAGLLLIPRRQPKVLLAAAALSIGPLVLWVYSRTVGLPFGPGAGAPEPIGLPDLTACALEVMTLVVAVVLMCCQGWLRRRQPVSAHVRSLALVMVIAVSAVGLAGSGVPWLDGLGSSADQPVMVSGHR